MKPTIDKTTLLSELRFHYDAGHAWLRVPLWIFRKYQTEVSSYSYFSYDAIYLEEDCDVFPFLEKAGIRKQLWEIIEVDDGDLSPIRKLPSYTSVFQFSK